MNKKTKEHIQELKQAKMGDKILLQQMENEARKEKFLKLCHQYKKQIIYAGAVLVVVVASYSALLISDQMRQEKYSKVLHQILISENNDDEAKVKELYEKIAKSRSAPASLKSVALLKYGSKLVNKNKIDEAVAIYEEASSLNISDKYIQELSGLLALKTMIDADVNKYKDRIVKLLPKLEKKSLVLATLILEQKGIFNWLTGNKELAQEIFKDLGQNPDAPEYLRIRAKEYYSMMK